ncbi:MAG: hypothetical protein LC658_08670, partial [Bacteroidales bacterium]|nr:hypothetical protein [Bacteroidales bacterium]
MKIREITVGELPDFIRSKEYALLKPKPITPRRALSQFKNPQARPEDVALVFASEDNTLLAFAGILPHAAQDLKEPVFSNSGWWVHPELGRKFGLPVLLKAFQHCNGRMFLTDCTAHTKSILDKTNLFHFIPPVTGSRFFLRFYTSSLLRRKGKKGPVTFVFSIVDKLLNIPLSYFVSIVQNKKQNDGFSIDAVKILNSEHNAFIQKNPGKSFLTQDAGKLNWVVQYPWVTTESDNTADLYPFTHKVESFKQEFLEIRHNKRLAAILLLSVRDNHASVPFIYFEKNVLNHVAQMLWNYLVKIKVDSLVVFHQELEEALRKNKRIWLIRKDISRYAGYSKELKDLFAENGYFFQ